MNFIEPELTKAAADRHAKVQHLDQRDLAQRWKLSPRTLERWRWQRTGPRYLKVGRHIAYRLADVEAYEAAQASWATP